MILHGIDNPYWKLAFSSDAPAVAHLGFDATGQGRWCDNLLKTGLPKAAGDPLVKLCGGQTGYFTSPETLYHSSSSLACSVQSSGQELAITGIAYGQVRESWRIKLEGDALIWTVDQHWQADTDVADSFTPGLFFTARPQCGHMTVFELWDRDHTHDAFYTCDNPLALTAGVTQSRRMLNRRGGWSVAKLLSHACPNGDLRVTVTEHLKKGEVLNVMSMLAHAAAPQRMRKDEHVSLTMTLQPVAGDTGLALDVELHGELAADNATNRRFFDTHANCAILADTVNWRFGNEPSGYVAPFTIWMQSELLKFGVMRSPLCRDGHDAHQVLAHEVSLLAGHCAKTGTIGPGYLDGTALDQLPALLLAARDRLLISGDRKEAEQLWPGLQRAVKELSDMLDRGRGLIYTERDNGNDYWDWIDRNGWIGYVNMLTYAGLVAFEEIARWLGRDVQTPAQSLKNTFNQRFWLEDRGYYADWIDKEGQPQSFLYVGPQLMGIAVGMVPLDRARRIVHAIRQRRRELGPDWNNCFSLQTNFHDAEAFSYMYRNHQSDVTRFGQTMNGGCLLSWNYDWIGALVACGYVDEAIDAWQRVVRRFSGTSLIEGCNYWDYAGQPSRTMHPPDEMISYEPFLSDQGLVSLALPRWLLGIRIGFDGITTHPVLPASAYPVTVKLTHLGREVELRIDRAARA
ncbi:MAG: hypothetical protein IT440_06885 [Phycisphaeraceae bacterium]|nr:hypothetical protein [Phycisphaeraceae bacterium]